MTSTRLGALKGTNHGLSTIPTLPLFTPAGGPFTSDIMAGNLATLLTSLDLYLIIAPQAEASQERWGRAGVELQGGFTLPFRGGEDGFLARSPENGQSLWGRKIPNGDSWQNKSHGNTVLVFIWSMFRQLWKQTPTVYFFASLSSFSSHIVGVCLRHANEFKY